jgi:rare lipoprotein A (peptidoglycan hydrolase)
MRAPLEQIFALAAIALLAAAVALAIGGWNESSSHSSPTPVGQFVALASSAGPAATGRRTACGDTLKADTMGIAHPTLPCGARIFIDFHGKHVLTQVVDRGPYAPGRQFDVTDALARLLGLQGIQQVHWSYAQAG